MMLTLGGVFGSAACAVFTMGIFMPIVNYKGAMVGSICGTGESIIYLGAELTAVWVDIRFSFKSEKSELS